MLDANDLTYMRGSCEELFPDTCNILSKTEVVSSAGNISQTWGTVSASVMCRADWLSGMVQLAGGGLKPYKELQLVVPHDISVSTDNRLEWGGGTYAITSVSDNSWPLCKFIGVSAVE